MTTDMTMEDILKYAIKIEHESMTFYRDASSKVTASDAQTLLVELRNEEIKHEDRLTDLLLKADSVAVFGFSEEELKRMISNRDIATDAAVKDVLEVALEREKLTRDFYRQVSTLTNISATAIETFDMLFEQESGHVTRISRILEKL